MPVLVGCAPVHDVSHIDPPVDNYSVLYQAEAGEVVWVAQEFQGGNEIKFKHKERPDSVKMMLDYGIAVYNFYSINLPVCLAIGCPHWRVRHHALIRSIDQEKAAELGFLPMEMAEDYESLE